MKRIFLYIAFACLLSSCIIQSPRDSVYSDAAIKNIIIDKINVSLDNAFEKVGELNNKGLSEVPIGSKHKLDSRYLYSRNYAPSSTITRLSESTWSVLSEQEPGYYMSIEFSCEDPSEKTSTWTVSNYIFRCEPQGDPYSIILQSQEELQYRYSNSQYRLNGSVIANTYEDLVPLESLKIMFNNGNKTLIRLPIK